ncbi:dipeptide ABC transporter ATP-binding protein [Corynebacterium lowii]|uniref:Glutathione import ATP-binding protein GsiA n=1 Tax=Corynebacterium lowii TaxID=1544413 RepID=A0A0Q0YX03_9CORY|nr:ABC transporter ATP-binding protein [Corynebacterium lowii]KQB86902.1 Glutathione import ATP-binding protein GsiA [Corynebacterium lowii]MDP9851590.1 peptide/nickel transport system ATP-binding protein [Corynebacterium lowii]
MSTHSAVLSVENLGISDLVEGVSFELRPGQRVGLIGESGSGKSLTALALMGLCPLPVRGNIRLGDTELVGAREKSLRSIRGQRIAMVFQEPMTALNPLMTVGTQLIKAMKAHGRDLSAAHLRDEAAALFRDVGLHEEHLGAYPHQLSGGQRQRVLIAMALSQSPEVLICDEPTTALDATVQRQIIEVILRVTEQRNIALLFISHDLSLVSTLCDHLLVMESGRIIERGSTEEILRQPQQERTRALIAATQLSERSPSPAIDAPLETAIEVTQVSRTFSTRGRTVEALREVSLRVPQGTRLGIVGGSGSGKTTLLRMIAGLEQPDSGSVRVHGRTHMVFQDPYSSFNPRMKVGTAITEALRLPRAQRTERAARLMEQVGLNPGDVDKLPHEFSGGQRQRLSLARALSVDPDVLLADEAVSALDVTVRARVLDLLDQAVTPERTLVFVSHELGVIRHLCTEVVVMRAGEIVERGPVERVWKEPEHPYTRELLAAITPALSPHV